MLHITIIALGKFKESHWREAEAEYLKRLSPYAKVNSIEIAEESFRDLGERDAVRKKEAEKIKKQLPDGAVVIALTEEGKEYDSPAFADFLAQHSTRGEHLVFVLGGPLGLDREFLTTCQFSISLSQLTFPHQLARVVLAEQLYRAATIMNGKQYHY